VTKHKNKQSKAKLGIKITTKKEQFEA